MSKCDPKIQGEVILELLEKYPLLPSRTIARTAFDLNPGVFNSVDTARARVRYYRGAYGKQALSELKDKKFAKIWEDATVTMPEGIEEPREDYILPKVNNNILLLPDIHVPYHDTKAIKIAINWAKAREVNTIILTGDFIDFHALSSFMKDPRDVNFIHELDVAYEVLYWIAEQMPNAKIYFLPGNHEFRYERYMVYQAPRLLETDEWGLNNLLKFHELGVQTLKYKQLIKAGDLFIGHGDELKKGGSGVNPARGFFLKAKGNYIGSHFHRSSNHSENDISGATVRCYSMGCLCGLTPKYMPYNNWNHGFARIRVKGNEFDVFNAEITKDGRITG